MLFLDEPTLGLDVVSQQRVRDFLRRLNVDRGTTILLTSDYMANIEALCPRVFVIDRGRIGYDGALADLVVSRSLTKLLPPSTPSWSILVLCSRRCPRAIRSPLIHLASPCLQSSLPGTTTRKLQFSVSREDVGDVVDALIRLGPIADLGVEESPVDDIIRQIFVEAAQREVTS